MAGLTAFSLPNVGGLEGLPMLALPAMLAGAPASPGLVQTAFVGIAGFCLVAIFGVIILHTDRPLATTGTPTVGHLDVGAIEPRSTGSTIIRSP